MTGVEEWLDAHGLGGHAEAYRRDGDTLDLLGDLTEADLKELGLGVGDRKRFFRAVAELEDAKGPEPRKPDDHAPMRSGGG